VTLFSHDEVRTTNAVGYQLGICAKEGMSQHPPVVPSEPSPRRFQTNLEVTRPNDAAEQDAGRLAGAAPSDQARPASTLATKGPCPEHCRQFGRARPDSREDVSA
jgi:hypothetical protein